MGRQSKLTPERMEIMLEHLREGNYDVVAAQAAGITRQTFYRYLRRGKTEKEGEYFEFYQAVEKAKAEGEVALLKTVKTAAQRTWQAAAWMLERSRPDRWALRKSTTTVAENWKKEILQMLKDGDATPEDVIEVVGEDLAYELFERAGIAVSRPGEAEKESVPARGDKSKSVSD